MIRISHPDQGRGFEMTSLESFKKSIIFSNPRKMKLTQNTIKTLQKNRLNAPWV